MPNPWDVPPLPLCGDETEDQTYIGVGRVMTQWESIEFNLARLYSTFLGAPDGYDELRQYGEGRIFRDRLDAVNIASDRYFIANSGQDIEGGYFEITAYAQGFSDRRNEVAHGVVFRISGMSAIASRMKLPAGKDQYALIPPLHTLRKHDEEGFPSYVYTSHELLNLRDSLVLLSEVIHRFRLHILG